MTKSELTLFKLLNELLNFLHYLTAQLLVILRLFLPWLGKSRFDFEKLNFQDSYARSFAKDNLQADFAFEVSSQGEFQQVLEIIKSMLVQGKKVEIIYASPSLENDMQSFKSHYSLEQLRVLRLPILIRSLFWKRDFQVKSWVTSSKFGFVRYDFYPHLLSMCFKRKMEVYLFWGSLKNKLSGAFSSWFWKNLSRCFAKVFAANNKNKLKFIELNDQLQVETSELRTLSIESRLQQKEEVFNKKNVSKLVELLKSDKRQKIILGSAYFEDLEYFDVPALKQKVLNKEVLVLIAPHSLAEENLNRFSEGLNSREFETLVLADDSQIPESDLLNSGVLLFYGKGLLCEFYSLCDVAYVGGGFEKSIHSVLEPYWSGCHVVCGPKTHRSTEFDFCKELKNDRIDSFATRQEIGQAIVNIDTYKNDFHNRDELFNKVLRQEMDNLENLL
jgi:3-deoxy-D-manno-octulosonic-acid transferase